MDRLEDAMTRIREGALAPEGPLLARLIAEADLDQAARAAIAEAAAELVRRIREEARPGLMEVFLSEYGLSTEEGIALMCLAEALLRVPDAETMDALIEDKIAPSDWGRHLGRSASPLVNASTWALMLTGKVLEDDDPATVLRPLRQAVRRLGEPVIRRAARAAMREMGRQFVLGETIGEALKNARQAEREGFLHSYDMLGEAARTEADARRYHLAYARAIAAIAPSAKAADVRDNPGISVKLSALHPRYERAKREQVLAELVPRVHALALLAREADIGFTIDAEEAERLELSLEVIAAVLASPELAGWEGFGVVVQAYGRRAGAVIDWLHALAERLDRRIQLRLVKGAYWDAEIKRAQVLGLESFPVFTRKATTDVAYIALARRLLGMGDRIWPQFATHNAHTAEAVLHMADGDTSRFEFQRLHGMGEALHGILHRERGTRCRIYAPVGAHRDLLAYLVRRLLENGANSSFVHRVVNAEVPPEVVAADPIAAAEKVLDAPENPRIAAPPALFPNRDNSRGFDLTLGRDLARIEAARSPFAETRFTAGPLVAGAAPGAGDQREIRNPARPSDMVGHVRDADAAAIEAALTAARPWAAAQEERREILGRAARLYEENFGRFLALLAREAGKTLPDGVAELREAVDFLHYYRAHIADLAHPPLGRVAAISPWNFPLAIFTGQIAAALAAGNAVIAKPAEQTPLVAHEAVRLLHEAGVPATALQLLPGDGPTVGARLVSDPRIDGVVFTGSTGTARLIERAMADNLAPGAPLIAETGGINAMIVDSTALPEQAVRDIVTSAFQSAGQRCSALRCLYVQEDIAGDLLEMLFGAMDALELGDPWALSTDIGPVIDEEARAGILAHVEAARREGRVMKELKPPAEGVFVGPVAIRVGSIREIEREVFGPVLHVATFRAGEIDRIVRDINASGHGLTFGMHSRIDGRVETVTSGLEVGNIYVNRNQIGAVVGSQPFGGEKCSGTGPKAGGPHYLPRFTRWPEPHMEDDGTRTTAEEVAARLAALDLHPHRIAVTDMPGPTGESNRLSLWPRGVFLCLGPSRQAAEAQADMVRAAGAAALPCPGLEPEALTRLPGVAGAVWWGDPEGGRAARRALAAREGPILPLVTVRGDEAHFQLERHLCIDTTATGGNATLLASAGEV